MTQRLALFSLLLFWIAGCASYLPVKPFGPASEFDESAFMSLWKTYQTCESQGDLATMRGAAQRLREVAMSASSVQLALPLPHVITRHIAKPTPRLSVDPTAMAAACSLLAARAAVAAGEMGVATELFRSVLAYPSSQYQYYSDQARAGLVQAGIQEYTISTSPPAAPLLAAKEIKDLLSAD